MKPRHPDTISEYTVSVHGLSSSYETPVTQIQFANIRFPFLASIKASVPGFNVTLGKNFVGKRKRQIVKVNDFQLTKGKRLQERKSDVALSGQTYNHKEE